MRLSAEFLKYFAFREVLCPVRELIAVRLLVYEYLRFELEAVVRREEPQRHDVLIRWLQVIEQMRPAFAAKTSFCPIGGSVGGDGFFAGERRAFAAMNRQQRTAAPAATHAAMAGVEVLVVAHFDGDCFAEAGAFHGVFTLVSGWGPR